MSTDTRERPTVHVYRTAPQKETRAEKELRDVGVPAFVPREARTYRVGHHRKRTVKVPVAPGYVFAGAKPYFAKHVRERVGGITFTEFLKFHDTARAKTPPPKAKQFNPGDIVTVKIGHFAGIDGKIVSSNGSVHLVLIKMLGKDHLPAVHEAHMQRKIDPG